jgi:excisionase family DNA binding protein
MFQPMAVPRRNTLQVATPETKSSLTPAVATSEQVCTGNESAAESRSDETQSASQIISSYSGTLEWLTVAEAAGYLKVKSRTLLAWARLGKVKGYPLSGTQRRTWRFLKVDLDDTIVRNSQCAAKERSDAA